MTLEGLKNYFSTIHWPQTIVLSVFVICAFGAPVLFFTLVPHVVIKLLIDLPWLTILGPGVTALIAAMAAIRGFFGPSVLKKKDTQPAPEKDETHEES